MYEITVTFIQIMIRMYMEYSTSGNNDYSFFPSGHGNKSYHLIGSWRGPDFCISDHGHSNACVSFFSERKTVTLDLKMLLAFAQYCST